MPIGQAVVTRVTGGSGGPLLLTWSADINKLGVRDAVTGITNLGAAIDAIKPLANALPGTIQRVEITIISE